jgi:hypothetical protein
VHALAAFPKSTHGHAGHANRHSLVETLPADPQQTFALGINTPHRDSLRQVAVEAVEKDGDVDIDQVAFLEPTAARIRINGSA